MENIKVPDRNGYDEKAKAFIQTRLGRKLARKYTPKPYEERRRGLYIFAWVGSFFCNLVAIVTGSTFVFAYAMGLVAKLPEPMVWAGLIAGVLLVGIEALKQLLVPDLFQDWFQFGWKGAYIMRVGAIVGLVAMSTAFNYFGGFDLVDVATTPPQYQEPELKSADQVRNEYQGKINQAGKEAEQHRLSRLWRGKLSASASDEYRDLLAVKTRLEEQMLAKLDSVEAYNDRATTGAKAEHQQHLQEHESKVTMKGRGLAVFSVVCELLFILFCWYRERYEFKTATQYAYMDDEDLEEPEHNTDNGTPLLHRHTQKNGKASATGKTSRLPIGFYTPAQRRAQIGEQDEGETEGGELLVLTKRYTKTKYLDTFTIEHNGKRYRLADVERFMRTYQGRLKQSEQVGDTKTAERRRKQFEYWKGRRVELLAKIETAENGNKGAGQV